MGKKVLLLYISEDSGHHCASIAIERALHKLSPEVETSNLNLFNYTNPIMEKVINGAYMSVVKRRPEIWDYLYDNPKVLRQVQRLREKIHRSNTGKLKTLLDEFRPDGVICTQAFPCGLIADYKKTAGMDVPLIGVLTDYAPHSYWIFDNIDRYIVPSQETGKKLIENGIEPSRIMDYGIPLEAKFSERLDREAVLKKLSLDRSAPTILVMGGTQGLGPIKELVTLLDRSRLRLNVIIACGTNKKLYRWLNWRARHFRKKTLVLPFADNIDELMEASDIIITKPGGITTAEALAKGLPMLIINPLPGQEAMNTKFLLSEGVAVKAQEPVDVIVLLEELLYNRAKLRLMSDKARKLAKPDSAARIAQLTLELAKA